MSKRKLRKLFRTYAFSFGFDVLPSHKLAPAPIRLMDKQTPRSGRRVSA